MPESVIDLDVGLEHVEVLQGLFAQVVADLTVAVTNGDGQVVALYGGRLVEEQHQALVSQGSKTDVKLVLLLAFHSVKIKGIWSVVW